MFVKGTVVVRFCLEVTSEQQVFKRLAVSQGFGVCTPDSRCRYQCTVLGNAGSGIHISVTFAAGFVHSTDVIKRNSRFKCQSLGQHLQFLTDAQVGEQASVDITDMSVMFQQGNRIFVSVD